VGRFGHREHLELAWSYVRAEPLAQACDSIAASIRAFAAREGASDLYHETLTRFWVLAVAIADAAYEPEHFAQLLERAPHLLDKALPERHWTAERLWSPDARRDWVPPDLVQLP
jgi:hypothetical protein